MSPLVDRSRLSSEPLTFTHRAGARITMVVLALVLTPLMTWFGTALILNPNERHTSGRRSALFEGHGAVTQMWGVLLIVLAFGIVLSAVPVFVSRVILTREGIRVVRITGVKDLPWPPSRSALVVTDTPGDKGSRSTMVWLVAPDGSAIKIPGTARAAAASKRERVVESLRMSLADADTIWEWARSRGLVRDNGQYVATTKREVEDHRLSAADERALRGL